LILIDTSVWVSHLRNGNPLNKPSFYVIILIICLALIIFSKLGYNALPNYDDSYYAQKAKEILKSGNIWIVKFNNRPRFDNPPMHFWIIALMYKVFGINEYAARFPSALFTLFLLWFVFKIGKLIFEDEWKGFFASFCLSTTFFLTKFSLRAMTDITLTLFFTLSIYWFIKGVKQNRLIYFILAGIMNGFAILTKSYFGLLPLIVASVFLLFKKQWNILFSLKYILLVFFSFGVASPWFIINHLRYPEQFIRTHFNWLLVSKTVGGNPRKLIDHFHYIKVIFSYGLPWVPFAIYGSYVILKERKNIKTFDFSLILVLWAWLVVIILTVPQMRKAWYIMPTFIASAIISGSVLEKWVKDKKRFAQIVVSLYFIGMILIVILPIDLNADKSNDLKKVSPIVQKLVPVGQKVLNFKQDYWANVSAFLFYTDRALTRKSYTPEQVINKLKKKYNICYTHQIDFKKYMTPYRKDIKIIAYLNKHILFCHKNRWSQLDTLLDTR